jgi:hypothetical protein
MVAMLSHTHQDPSRLKARSGIKWLNSRELKPRIPQIGFSYREPLEDPCLPRPKRLNGSKGEVCGDFFLFDFDFSLVFDPRGPEDVKSDLPAELRRDQPSDRTPCPPSSSLHSGARSLPAQLHLRFANSDPFKCMHLHASTPGPGIFTTCTGRMDTFSWRHGRLVLYS